MRPPTFENIAPWATLIDRVAKWCMWLGAANNVAIMVARPPLTDFQFYALAFWWAPIAVTNLILSHVMLRWAIARLRAFEREHPDIFP